MPVTNTIPPAQDILDANAADPDAYIRYAQAVLDFIANEITTREAELLATGITFELPQFQDGLQRDAWNRIGQGIHQAITNRGYGVAYTVEAGIVTLSLIIEALADGTVDPEL